MELKYALAGNPNCGKTTLFNALTGSNQYVGNWPGVTVEKKEGKLRHGGNDITIVDLPGIYSLSPYSSEEIVTRNFLIDEKPDLIINIVDATNLERNLYLTLQIAELGCPMVIALNMMDVVEKQGDKLDAALLSSLLNIDIVPISASKGDGIHKLIHACAHTVEHNAADTKHVDIHNDIGTLPEIYTGKVKTALELIENTIFSKCSEKGLPLRWMAVKLLEGDAPTVRLLGLSDDEKRLVEEFTHSAETDKLDREMLIADQKYKFICKTREHVLKRSAKYGELTLSDKIDRIVTNRFIALPLFAAVMLLIFYITFGALGARLTGIVDTLVNVRFSDFVREALVGAGAADWAVGLICDGVIQGLGAVVAFFPQIALLFFFLSLLEDSGYMSRGAFIMDRALHTIGLSGRSFVPLLMGFGCSVPAIMCTRTLENDRDRRLTIMLVPFMSCSAKMPVYALFISAFFASYRGITIFAVYFTGIIVAILCAFILQKTVLGSGHAPFVMELPSYRMPTAKSLVRHLWDKIKDFFTKAGTVLLGASIVIWFFQYFDFSFDHVVNSAESILGVIGTAIAPVFKPLGFGDWQSSVAILSGLIARESIVSTLGILHGTGSGSGELASVLNTVYSPASAYALMTFSLLFIPCIAAVTTIRREMKSAKFTAFALAFQAVVAWVVTFIVYRIASIIYLTNESVPGKLIDLAIILFALLCLFTLVRTLINRTKKSCSARDCSNCSGCSQKKG